MIRFPLLCRLYQQQMPSGRNAQSLCRQILQARKVPLSACMARKSHKMKKKEAKTVKTEGNLVENRTSLIAEMLMEESPKEPVQYGHIHNQLEEFDKRLAKLDEILTQSSKVVNMSADDHDENFDDDGESVDLSDSIEKLDDNKHYLEEIILDKINTMTILPSDQMKQSEAFRSNKEGESTSEVPCPGCGAILHCQRPEIPGYLPAEKYKSVSQEELRDHFCQRCYMMKNYNKALALSVDPSVYVEIVSRIRDVTALTILVVDLLDIEGSLIRNLPALIGTKRPVFILGNKVDLLPSEERGYLKHIKEVLEGVCRREGLYDHMYVHYTALISAKTGYGIEELITKLFKFWSRRGHVYLLGCTNVGKSSLFNVLLSSDYCKATSRDLIHRATISAWPGTTLNLLKFPILAPDGMILQQRMKRLIAERKRKHEEQKLSEKLEKPSKVLPLQAAVGQTLPGKRDAILENHHKSIHGYIGATYSYSPHDNQVKEIKLTQDTLRQEIFGEKEVFDESVYAESKWCHDTPGLVNPDQLMNILNQEELSLVLPKTTLKPRNFVIKPGTVVFLSGLGRLDYFKGNNVIYLTVYACKKLPVHTMPYETSDDFYREHLSTNTFKVPIGGPDRLERLPSLIGREFVISGNGWKQSAADIVLSSLGWISVTTGYQVTAHIRAYTPGGRGCYLRMPPILRHGILQKGKRIGGSSAYKLPSRKKKAKTADEYWMT